MDLTCSCHDVAEKLLVGIKKQPLTHLIYYEKKEWNITLVTSLKLAVIVLHVRLWYTVFNTTYNYISVILWW